MAAVVIGVFGKFWGTPAILVVSKEAIMIVGVPKKLQFKSYSKEWIFQKRSVLSFFMQRKYLHLLLISSYAIESISR